MHEQGELISYARRRAAARVLTLALLTALVSLAVPAHAPAAPRAPQTLETAVGVASSLAPGRALAKTVRLPWRANMLGVSFLGPDQEEAVTLEARALRETGWSEWWELHVEADEGADPDEARRAIQRVFTVPQWLGTASAIEVRARVAAAVEPVRDLRVHAINTLGDAEPRPLLGRMLDAVGGFLARRAISAHAHPGKPSIITRAEWGADESWRTDAPGNARSLKMAFVHHTVNSNSYSRSEAYALVRGVYRYHTKTRGYSDIGYNFIVDRYGRTFEGRWGGVDKPVIGAHTLGFNRYSTGVALLGTFTSVAPTSSMLTGLKRLLAWKLDVHHVPPTGKVLMTSAGNDRYDEGEQVWFNRISGHRDAKSTSCPGYQTYRRLPAIRDAVRAYGNPKIYLPSSTWIVRPDGDGVRETVTVKATFSKSVSWRLTFSYPSGTVRRTLTGSGTSMSASWDGMTATGAPVPTGVYTWRLTAADANGHAATPAAGKITVVTTHPSGTALTDASGSFLTYAGEQRSMTDPVRTSRYGSGSLVPTGPVERGWYAPGLPLTPRFGGLFAGPDGSRYIYSGGTLRRFDNGEIDVFAALGHDPADLIAVDATFVATLPPGTPVTDPGKHVDGTVIREKSTGKEWLISGGSRRPLSLLARRSYFRSTEVVYATARDLLEYTEGSAYPVRAGALIAPADAGPPWVVIGTSKRRFRTTGLFSAMGYTGGMLLSATAADLAAVPTGPTYG